MQNFSLVKLANACLRGKKKKKCLLVELRNLKIIYRIPAPTELIHHTQHEFPFCDSQQHTSVLQHWVPREKPSWGRSYMSCYLIEKTSILLSLPIEGKSKKRYHYTSFSLPRLYFVCLIPKHFTYIFF